MSTAGMDTNSICFEVYDYARKLLDPGGELVDTAFYPVVYEAPRDAAWDDEAVWRAANPSYGITLNEVYFHECLVRIREMPSELLAFQRLHLNWWTQTETAWLELRTWDAAKPGPSEEELIGRKCYGGLDLSTSIDLTAFVLVFPLDDGRFAVLPRYWIPQDGMLERQRRDRVPYDVWARRGYVRCTPGNVIDHKRVRADIVEDGKKFSIQNIGYDPWSAARITDELSEDGFTMLLLRQGYKTMSPPAKEFERLVVQGRIAHNGNAVLRWNVECCAIESDNKGNICPKKPPRNASGKRIDGVVALVMALDQAAVRAEKNTRSIYETRGLLIL
jgi:phage terminase large subunit-like protein